MFFLLQVVAMDSCLLRLGAAALHSRLCAHMSFSLQHFSLFS